MSNELKRLEEANIIEKINSSAWISNLVVARRKNKEIRLCIDLREVNKAIIPDKYPLPTMTEMAAEFHGSTVYTKLDLRRSYLQVPLEKHSRHLTAFITHDGVFQYCRVPYGLSSAPSCFQKIISDILQDIPGVMSLLDDIVVHASTQIEHDERLNQVMPCLAEQGLTLNVAKCDFSKQEIDFLGYRISASGLHPTTSNIEAIMKLPEPVNVKELASFLGTTNFYANFVPHYADIVEPLRKLLRKEHEWSWSTEQSDAYNRLKQCITSPPVLAHFDPNADTYVTTDASGVALGAQLSQVIDGVEPPVAFASKTLSETERKYSTGEREALACIYACEHWHIYLYGRHFTLRTDHQSLTTLLATSGSGHRPLRIYRWSDRLYQYNYDIQYTSKHNNHVADMLSRFGHGAVQICTTGDLDEENQILEIMTEPLNYVNLTMDELTRESERDPAIKQLRLFTQNGWPTNVPAELEPYARFREEFSVYNDYCVARGLRSVIPQSLQAKALEVAHDGHPGIVRMKQ